MKKNKLIKKLLDIEGNPEVCIDDWRKNLNDDCGEGSSVGVEPDFTIELIDKDSLPENTKPWIALSFNNDDYEDDGSKSE
jgi:hypothetical protein